MMGMHPLNMQNQNVYMMGNVHGIMPTSSTPSVPSMQMNNLMTPTLQNMNVNGIPSMGSNNNFYYRGNAFPHKQANSYYNNAYSTGTTPSTAYRFDAYFTQNPSMFPSKDLVEVKKDFKADIAAMIIKDEEFD